MNFICRDYVLLMEDVKTMPLLSPRFTLMRFVADQIPFLYDITCCGNLQALVQITLHLVAIRVPRY
jgi:hypothetical protein